MLRRGVGFGQRKIAEAELGRGHQRADDGVARLTGFEPPRELAAVIVRGAAEQQPVGGVYKHIVDCRLPNVD
jgi:hypothetical protein